MDLDYFFAKSKRKNQYDIFITGTRHKYGLTYVDGFYDNKKFTLVYDDMDKSEYWFKGCRFNEISQDIIARSYFDRKYVNVNKTG